MRHASRQDSHCLHFLRLDQFGALFSHDTYVAQRTDHLIGPALFVQYRVRRNGEYPVF